LILKGAGILLWRVAAAGVREDLVLLCDEGCGGCGCCGDGERIGFLGLLDVRQQEWPAGIQKSESVLGSQNLSNPPPALSKFHLLLQRSYASSLSTQLAFQLKLINVIPALFDSDSDSNDSDSAIILVLVLILMTSLIIA
jgi:hypothetical protein